VRMATDIHLMPGTAGIASDVLLDGEVAWVSQATCCHAHFGLKSAPQHRDFRPGKVGISS